MLTDEQVVVNNHYNQIATYRSSKKAPFSSWYPYLEGYSPEFVKETIKKFIPNSKVLFDPFAGTVSTGFGASDLGIKTFYCEINPVLQFIAKVKSQILSLDEKNRMQVIEQLENRVANFEKDLGNYEKDKNLESKYKLVFGESVFFDEANFNKILTARSYLDNLRKTSWTVADLFELAILSSLVPSSLLKRAGDLRYKTEKELQPGTPDFVQVLKNQLLKMKNDISGVSIALDQKPILICENARNIHKIPYLGIDGLITSPPYLNGTNYFRNTKMELWFLGCLRRLEDLSYFREGAVTAGINNVKNGKNHSKIESVEKIVDQLSKKAYDRRIPIMIRGYFSDLQDIFLKTQKHLTDDATIAIDIGDSQYAGIHVPTDKLLIDTLEDINYNHIKTVKLRDRHSKNGEKLSQVLLVFKVGR